MSSRKENIVMFPFMAQGHIIPFVALALKLEQENGFSITFVNTPLNIKNLRSILPPKSSVRLVEIPFNSPDHGLPPNTENTNNLPAPLILRLIESSFSLKPVFRKLVSNLVNELQESPFCIISDMFFAWSAEVAHEFGAFHAIYNAGGAYGMAVFHTMWSYFPHKKENRDEFALIGFPDGYKLHVKEFPEDLRNAKGTPVCLQTMLNEWLKTDGMLFNTVEELEHIGLTYFRRQFQCPVWPVGPILSSLGSKVHAGKESQPILNLCMKWLDAKPEKSVMYVAFGSQYTPSVSQTKQLAMALEASGKFFIWVVRPPSSLVADSNFKEKEWLPKGFEDRIRDNKKGLLVQQWAPQMEILSHKSISLFLSHCGWNSVLEALSNGVPILSWPMSAEQPYNAKMLEEEIGVAIGVANGSDCEVKHEDIVRKIELAMNETEKGMNMRGKACEVKEMIKYASGDRKNGVDGSSVKAMDDFLHAVLLRRKKISKVLERNGA